MSYLIKKLGNLYNTIKKPIEVKEACKRIKTESIEDFLLLEYKCYKKTKTTFEEIKQFVTEYNYPITNYLKLGIIYEGLYLLLKDRGINSQIAQELYDSKYTLYCKLH